MLHAARPPTNLHDHRHFVVDAVLDGARHGQGLCVGGRPAVPAACANLVGWRVAVEACCLFHQHVGRVFTCTYTEIQGGPK